MTLKIEISDNVCFTVLDQSSYPGEERFISLTCVLSKTENEIPYLKTDSSMEAVRVRTDANFIIGISLQRTSMVPKPVRVTLSRRQHARGMNTGRLYHVWE